MKTFPNYFVSMPLRLTTASTSFLVLSEYSYGNSSGVVIAGLFIWRADSVKAWCFLWRRGCTSDVWAILLHTRVHNNYLLQTSKCKSKLELQIMIQLYLTQKWLNPYSDYHYPLSNTRSFTIMLCIFNKRDKYNNDKPQHLYGAIFLSEKTHPKVNLFQRSRNFHIRWKKVDF